MFRLDQFNKFLGDCLSICLFLDYSLDQKVGLVKAATGWDTGIPELFRVAERVLTTARLFNVREGLSAADDVLPERFFQPKTDGALSDKGLDRAKLEKAKSFYYTLMGWDDKGVPLPEKVEELYIE
jgi:aldehyde:ferredoxin oxidoreductase